MLEAPERTAGEIWSWLEGPGREAWERAARVDADEAAAEPA